MDQSMLSFVLKHLPDYWDSDVSYNAIGYVLRALSKLENPDEYQYVETMFYGANISQIIRVQNPFQYGRFMLRREMVNSAYEVSTILLLVRTKLPVFIGVLSR